MAQKENTLGAPTEGLGQRVTFAFGAGGAVPQLSLGAEGDIQAGVKGAAGVNIGGTQATGVKYAPHANTADLLLGMASKVVQQKVEKKKQEAFVVGMQRAAAGEAVADIAKEQPWYSKVFGDSDTVEGARQYASQTIAQTEIAGMEEAMPHLRTLSPQAAQKFFSESIQKRMTGDTPTDAATMMAFTRAMPTLMKRQAKEHYGFLQENATKQETAAFDAGAINLQAQAKALGPDYRNDKDFNTSRQGFVQSILPPVGRDPDSYKKSMAANMKRLAQSGNFHALNALKESGFMDVLDPEQQLAVEKATDAGESRMRQKYSFQYNDSLAELTMSSQHPAEGVTPRDIATQVDVLNKKYMTETGSDSPLIDPAMRVAMISRSRSAILAEQEKQATRAESNRAKAKTAEDKAAAQADMDRTIALRAEAGSLGTLASTPGYSNDQIDTVATNLYNSKSPEDKVKFLVNNAREDYTIAPIKRVRVGQITAALSTGEYTPQVQQAFNEYVALREANPHVAAEYYGEHAKRLEGLYNDTKAGMSPAGAFRARFTGPASRANFSDKQMTDAMKLVGSSNWFMRSLTGEVKVRPGTQRRIANEISEETKGWYGANGDFNMSVELAYKGAKRNGLEVLGGMAWTNSKGQQSLETFLTKQHPHIDTKGLATDKVNELVAEAVDESLYGDSGVLTETAKDVQMFRLPDRAGVPVFHVQAVQGDGTVTDRTLTGTDVFILAKKRADRKANSSFGINNESLRFGPENKFRPADGARSIYD